MTQREKLIELIDKSDVPLCDECGTIPADIRIERLADFLLANGVVVPPCKPGDTVYQHDGVKVYAIKVRNVLFDAGFVAFDESAIGKSVFLAFEEAEAAVENMTPTDKQVAYATYLAQRTCQELPEEYTKKAYSDFIEKWKPIVKQEDDGMNEPNAWQMAYM